MIDFRLNLVTDEAAMLGRDFFAVVEESLKGGVDLVQLREKNLSDEVFLEKALRLQELLQRYDVPLVINDNVFVAGACGAAGIHVGVNDLAPLAIREVLGERVFIGYSIEEIQQMGDEGERNADYIAASPVFTTHTKSDVAAALGIEGVAAIRSLSRKPLFAIGGISDKNIDEVLRAGADCISVVSAICSADKPAKAAEELRNRIEKFRL